MSNLVLVRHGESVCNANQIFTGWLDSPLTEKGKIMAEQAGTILKENNYNFDISFTSYLIRAKETLNIILNELNINPPIKETIFLNERHYGRLEGMHKDDVSNTYGEELVQKWRRGLLERPPQISKEEYNNLINSPKYREIPNDYIPYTENLDDVNKRVIKYFKSSIEPYLIYNKNILVSAHQNSIRSIIYYLEKLSIEDMLKIETSNCTPIVYSLDNNLNILDKKILYRDNNRPLKLVKKR